MVGIDEAQFLGDSVVETCAKLADMGKRVIVAGLDTDFMGRPFEPMPRLLAVAEEIVKFLAICMRCGNPGRPHAAPGGVRGAHHRRRGQYLRSALPPLLRAPPRPRRKSKKKQKVFSVAKSGRFTS